MMSPNTTHEIFLSSLNKRSMQALIHVLDYKNSKYAAMKLYFTSFFFYLCDSYQYPVFSHPELMMFAEDLLSDIFYTIWYSIGEGVFSRQTAK